MKKLLFAVLLVFTALTTWGDAKVKSGSMFPLKDADVRVLVKWDYKNMLIEDKKPADFLREKGADWERDYPAEVAAGESAFAAMFNKKDKKYALITDDASAAQYEMEIHVAKFHYGSTAAGIIFGSFARGAHIEGTVDIVDRSTKSTIATINFECAGDMSYSNEQRRVLACEDLAKDLAKLVSKAKNK